MGKGRLAFALSAAARMACADDLCVVNPSSKAEAEQGKVALDSHCAFCHPYSLAGRIPGNSKNESPEYSLRSESDLRFLDGGGGLVPPLVGEKFFSKQKGKTLAEFTAFVSGAANTFPTKNMVVPPSYLQVAAYVLYRNCGKM